MPNDIDFIAASFVRKGSDIEYIRKVGFEGVWSASHVLVLCMTQA